MRACWSGIFDVAQFLDHHYTVEQLQDAWADKPRKAKLEELFNLVQRAQNSDSKE